MSYLSSSPDDPAEHPRKQPTRWEKVRLPVLITSLSALAIAMVVGVYGLNEVKRG